MSLAAILDLLSNLKAGENGYTALRGYLASQVLPIAPNSFRIQLYFLAAMTLL